MRVGGLDILFHGLAGQTHKDFELVLSDCLHSRRADIVKSKAADLGIRVVHVEPRENKFPQNFFCRCANEGLAAASGDVVLMFADYTWAPPGCLALHAEFHEANSGPTCLMGIHEYLMLPSTSVPQYKSDSEPIYSDAAALLYAQDIAAGRLDKHMWSLFDHDLKNPEGLGPDTFSVDPKIGGEQGPRTFFAKNDSMRRECVLEVNGWDESLDSSHGYQDWELSDRLTQRLGMNWVVDVSSHVYIINPRRILPHGLRIQPFEHNYAIWQSKVASNSWGNPNDWVLSRK